MSIIIVVVVHSSHNITNIVVAATRHSGLKVINMDPSDPSIINIVPLIGILILVVVIARVIPDMHRWILVIVLDSRVASNYTE